MMYNYILLLFYEKLYLLKYISAIIDLLHYVLLVSFMWIFIEGIHLYRLTKNAFEVFTTDWMRYYILLAYGGPLVIVVVTILCAVFTDGIIEVYSGDET